MEDTREGMMGDEGADLIVERPESPDAEEGGGHDEEGDGPREDAGPATAPPEPDNRRTLKLVLTLVPVRTEAGEPVWRAQLGAQQEGCDPQLRVEEVVDRSEALDLVPGFLAQAEDRWWRQPRNPKIKAAPKPAARPRQQPAQSQGGDRSAPKPAASPLARAEQVSTPEPRPKVERGEAEKPVQGQLSLFGG